MHARTHFVGTVLLLALLGAGASKAATKIEGPVAKPATAGVIPSDGALARMPEAALKTAYLACDANADPATAQAARCSLLHRELVSRVFSGDIGAFEAWAKANRAPSPRSLPQVPIRPEPMDNTNREGIKAAPPEGSPPKNDEAPQDPRAPVLAPAPIAQVH